VQICPVYGADAGDEARDVVRAQIAAFDRAVRENDRDVIQIRSARDLDRLDGRIGLILSMEGVEALHGDPAAFDELWDGGARMVSLTWNYANPFAGGIDAPEQGLTDAGRELVGSFADAASSSTSPTRPSVRTSRRWKLRRRRRSSSVMQAAAASTTTCATSRTISCGPSLTAAACSG